MRIKLIFSLIFLFMIFAVGAGITMMYTYTTTENLETVINLHRVEIIRQNLVISAQTVQGNLLATGTVFFEELDTIVENVTRLDNAILSCSGCHHPEQLAARIQKVGYLIEQFKDNLGTLVVVSASPERVQQIKMNAVNLGSSILSQTQEMALLAEKNLTDKTVKAVMKIKHSRVILFVTMVLAFFSAIAVAVTLTKQVTKPVYELVKSARSIASGNLGYTTTYNDRSEFGELASSFNEMSLTLKESNEKIMEHMNRLSGLYRITLPLHSVSNLHDICREVSYGVAELISVEQSGLLLKDEESIYFEQKLPAYGLDEAVAASIRIKKEDVTSLYLSSNRRPLIINDPHSEKRTKELVVVGDSTVRNMMLGWVRQKGELIGVIRIANKKKGDFTEDSAQLIGVISNNVSVAIENVKLYENLRAQMQELRETQEQLVQAAKLAAIGELASNVAHEINNPLTSIMGYAELIKEEVELDNIRRDIDIIEKESIRAKNIVQQLLEFARKRPLEIEQVDINSLIRDAISLIHVQMKDVKINMVEDLGELPSVSGDPNQLKQVILNIMNNSISALSDKSGELRIKTMNEINNVIITISDTGPGIPSDILPRIFEPFFTTKREKGTGLGLSITYNIIRSHEGTLDVWSEVGRGTKFTIKLPVKIGAQVHTVV